MKKILSVVILFTCSILVVKSAFAQDVYEIDQVLKKYLEIQNKRIGFNGIVLAMNDTGIISQQAVGFASYELAVPLMIKSKFKIASMTKSFTAFLVANAEMEGEIQYSDKLSDYFTQLPDEEWKQITIRQLLSHTSGIPHWSEYPNYWDIKSRLTLSNNDILTDIFSMKLLFPPGTRGAYSSPAYFILAIVLEKIYKNSFENILKEKIFSPLNMENTGVYSDLKIIPEMTTGYHLLTDDSLVVSPYRDISAMKGGGNLFSNVHDILTWMQSLTNKSALNSKLVKMIFTPLTDSIIYKKDNALYSMGWYLREKTSDSPASCYIGGGTFGFSVNPAEKTYIIIMCNVSFMPLDDVVLTDIENIIFRKSKKLPVINIEDIQIDDIQKFCGTYTTENGMKLDLFIHGNSLFARVGENPPFEIYPKSNNEFFGKIINVSLSFHINEKDKVEGLKAYKDGKVYQFEKQ